MENCYQLIHKYTVSLRNSSSPKAVYFDFMLNVTCLKVR